MLKLSGEIKERESMSIIYVIVLMINLLCIFLCEEMLFKGERRSVGLYKDNII